MKKQPRTICTILCLVITGLLSMAIDWNEPVAATAADAKAAAARPVPVEEDMHEFMEYVFEPAFKRLKTAMAVESKDRQAWKSIKSESLILAEGGNLLLMRAPEADADLWNQQSIAVRNLGSQLYQAARKKDDQAASQSYKTMVMKCNLCHQKFADGEHQLEP